MDTVPARVKPVVHFLPLFKLIQRCFSLIHEKRCADDIMGRAKEVTNMSQLSLIYKVFRVDVKRLRVTPYISISLYTDIFSPPSLCAIRGSRESRIVV